MGGAAENCRSEPRGPIYILRHLLPVFQDNKARDGIRRNGSKDSSQVSRRTVFVPEGETGRFGAHETQIKLNRHFYGLCTAFPQVVNEEYRILPSQGKRM